MRLVVIEHDLVGTRGKVFNDAFRVTRHQEAIDHAGACTKLATDGVFRQEQETLQRIRPADSDEARQELTKLSASFPDSCCFSVLAIIFEHYVPLEQQWPCV
ncbi:hypothetical protein D3C78_1671240 [compost metagenome]